MACWFHLVLILPKLLGSAFFLKSDQYLNTKTGFVWSEMVWFAVFPNLDECSSPQKRIEHGNCLISSLQRIHRSSNLHFFWVFKWEVVCGCFQKSWYPQIIHFNKVFHYKRSILGYPYFWKHPCGHILMPKAWSIIASKSSDAWWGAQSLGS